MEGHVSPARLLALAACVLQVALAARADELSIQIDYPGEGPVGALQGLAFIAGRASFAARRSADVVFLIDASDSTNGSSGYDVNRDGRAPREFGLLGVLGDLLPIPSDPADSVRAFELRAVNTLLSQLDPRDTRVAVMTFGGDFDPVTPDAELIVEPTSDFAEVRATLTELGRTKGMGRTNLSEGIRLAVAQLSAQQKAAGGFEPARMLLLFHDGRPTAPNDLLPENRQLSIESAKLARRKDIVIHTFGVGMRNAGAADEDLMRQLARITQGTYTRVENPSELYAPVSSGAAGAVESVTLENELLEARAEHFELNPDATFYALLPVRPGANPVTLQMRTRDGVRVIRNFELSVKTGAPVEPSDPVLADARRRLFERWSARVAPTR
jgi:Mg-chelatase subunit ChlD